MPTLPHVEAHQGEHVDCNSLNRLTQLNCARDTGANNVSRDQTVEDIPKQQ